MGLLLSGMKERSCLPNCVRRLPSVARGLLVRRVSSPLLAFAAHTLTCSQDAYCTAMGPSIYPPYKALPQDTLPEEQNKSSLRTRGQGSLHLLLG